MSAEKKASRIVALEMVAEAARCVEKSKELYDALVALDKIPKTQSTPQPVLQRYEHAVFDSPGLYIDLVKEKEKEGWELCCFGDDTVFMQRRLP